jgi:hypothetical protein
VQVDKESVRAAIRRAFADVPAPKHIADMRLPRYIGDDSYEMVTAFLGKRWTDIPIETLFRHRESLGTLTPAAYLAYLPAYLDASLASDDPLDKYGADIRYYLLATLKHWSHQADERATETRERLSALGPDQRMAVADVLRYLVSKWHAADAQEVLRDW